VYSGQQLITIYVANILADLGVVRRVTNTALSWEAIKNSLYKYYSDSPKSLY